MILTIFFSHFFSILQQAVGSARTCVNPLSRRAESGHYCPPELLAKAKPHVKNEAELVSRAPASSATLQNTLSRDDGAMREQNRAANVKADFPSVISAEVTRKEELDFETKAVSNTHPGDDARPESKALPIKRSFEITNDVRSSDDHGHQNEHILKKVRVSSDVATPTIPDPNADMQNCGTITSSSGNSQLYQADLRIVPLTDEETIQRHIISYGLLIVERDESGKATWICCKLCPIFGCKNRLSSYIKVYMAPFVEKEFLDHVESEHVDIWPAFDKMTPEMKVDCFKGRNLPKPRVFHRRVAVMKSDTQWRRKQLARFPDYERQASNANNSTQESGNGEKLKNEEKKTDFLDNTATTMLSRSHEISGEITSESEPRHLNLLKSDLFDISTRCGRHNLISRDIDANINSLPKSRPETLPPMNNELKHFHDMFTRHSIHPKIGILLLKGSLSDGAQNLSNEERGISFMSPERNDSDNKIQTDNDMCSIWGYEGEWSTNLAEIIFFYLLRGMQPSTISSFLDLMCSDITRPDLIKKPISTQVMNVTNGLCAFGLQLLRICFEDRIYNWGIVLTTKRCPEVGTGGVEVLISFAADTADIYRDIYRIHLLAVRVKIGAGEAVANVLDSVCEDWQTRLLGIWPMVSEECRKAKEVEAGILEWLLKADGVGNDVTIVNEKPQPESNPMYPWVLAKMERSQFFDLVNHNAKRFAPNDEYSVGTVLKEWELLKKMESPSFVDYDRLTFSEAWENCTEVAPLIKRMANGFYLLWCSQPCISPRPNETLTAGMVNEAVNNCTNLPTVVDAGAERVFWAREILQISYGDDGYGNINRVMEIERERVPWGANWNNWTVRQNPFLI